MTICYFGIYKPDFSRNRVYMKGLRKLGHTVIECRDDSKGLMKYVRLWQKHRSIKSSYDALIVGYGGAVVVPLAKLISNKIVIADLLGSLEDADVHSHGASFTRRWKDKIIDRLAIRFADAVLLESKAQKEYFEKAFGPSDKYNVVYTGTDEDEFAPVASGANAKTPDKFIVLFRGRLTPESGILYILQAADILKQDKRISFRIIGAGYLLQPVKEEIAKHTLLNVELISTHLSEKDLVKLMSEANISLGQFEDNPRLNRTIPHKAFDSFALGLPYLSGDAPAVREIVSEGKTGFLSPLADPAALAGKIKELSGKSELLRAVSMNERKMFNESLSSVPLAKQIMTIISSHAR